MYIRGLYIGLFLFFSFSCARAQNNLMFTAYGVDDGLPQSSVWSIVQDRQGFLWVGTSDGICRFDGYKFTVYHNGDNDSEQVNEGSYIKLYADSEGHVWSVFQSGICFYDEIKDKFVRVFSYQNSFSNNYGCIFSEDKRYIMAGMAGYGIIKIDKRSHQVQSTTSRALAGIFTWINAVVYSDEIWINGVQSGSYVYNTKTHKLDTIKIATPSFMVNFNDSELLMVSHRETVLVNKKNRSRSVIPLSFSKSLSIITGILKVSPSEIIVASSLGVFYVDTRTWKIVRQIKSFTPGQPNSFVYVQCIYKDRSGNIWLGTNGDGLKKLTALQKNFKHYSSFNAKGNLVKAIYADSKNIYAGYYDIGLDIFDRKAGLLKSVSLVNTPVKATTVFALMPIDSNKMIFQANGMNCMGIYSKDGSISNITPAFKALAPNSKSGSAHPFFLRSGNTIYTNFCDHYLMSVDVSARVLKPVLLLSMEKEMINCAYMEPKGTLWIGTSNGAFYMANGVTNKLDLRHAVHAKSINQDKDGNIWLGTINGIYVADSNKHIACHYTENNGLPNQFVYGILRDDDGNMWFSHNKGISVYKTAAKSFKHYTRDDGLQSNEFNTGAYFKAADGALFFGGINGLNSFYPAEIRDNPNVPCVAITSIRLFDEPLIADTSYWNVHSLTLPYTKNSLSFEFAALEYTNPDKNQYAYMMDGVDNTWINAGGKRFARYGALPPGEYVFKVKASNNDGAWQNIPTTIAIHIIPPFWQRWWFRVLGLLFLTGAVTGIIAWLQQQRHRRQIRALEQQQKMQEHIQLERERISRDLHDTVGTQLSLISNNIDWVANPLTAFTEYEKADKLRFVNDTARDIIATLRETIWALNRDQISFEEFYDKLKGFAQKQVAIYPDIALNFRGRTGTGIVLGPSEALNLFRIYQEAIANTLKYAHASTIDIDVRNIDGKYRISMADNGIGFDIDIVDPDVQNGLENMKFRAEDIECTLEIISKPGEGTRITVTKK